MMTKNNNLVLNSYPSETTREHAENVKVLWKNNFIVNYYN